MPRPAGEHLLRGRTDRRAALAAWSMAHGFASLHPGGSMPLLDGDPADAFRTLVDRLPHGA